MEYRQVLTLIVLAAALAACDSGDIILSPTTVDNSTSTDNSSTTTPAPAPAAVMTGWRDGPSVWIRNWYREQHAEDPTDCIADFRRVIPLDLFPTSIVESIKIQKSPSPDQPASFGGGAIDIRTTSVPNDEDREFRQITSQGELARIINQRVGTSLSLSGKWFFWSLSPCRFRQPAAWYSGAMASRFFNTTGPVVAADHYCIPPLDRIDLDEVLVLIRQRRYFVLHAPRQTGKTSALLALRDLLNSGAEGEYRCIYVNVEVGQAARENVRGAMGEILHELELQARLTFGDESLAGIVRAAMRDREPGSALREVLVRCSQSGPDAPLVLLIDEIDSLVGDTLLAVLRQLRAGYPDRPSDFPQSVVLCGVRDVRDYRIHSGSQNAIIAGGSAFNVKAASLRLGDFGEDEVRTLLAQHTAETGQEFTPKAVDSVWKQTRGQPWLVNALAYQSCFRDRVGRDRSNPIGEAAVIDAREQLIASRETHLDQLADKLQEARVRRVVGPLLSGGDEREFTARDVEYVRDLGLVAQDSPLRIANPIYAEVVPRELTWVAEIGLAEDPAWYIDGDGALDMDKLLAAFQEFFREHSEHWVERFQYREAGPQLLLQAFLQRIVNSGGRIEREYGLGRRRTDLLVLWPIAASGSKTPSTAARLQRVVVECKVLHRSLERTTADGLDQTRAYMDRCGAAEGHLVIFDRSEDRTWEEKLFRREEPTDGASITVWGI